jgi:hypothetical protein
MCRPPKLVLRRLLRLFGYCPVTGSLRYLEGQAETSHQRGFCKRRFQKSADCNGTEGFQRNVELINFSAGVV